jgi:hypothetical protein
LTLGSRNTPQLSAGTLVARIIGPSLALYGALAIWMAARALQASPGESELFDSIRHSSAWLNIAFGFALIAFGATVALRRAWTRGVDWLGCIIIALLIPAGFDALYELVARSRFGGSFPLLLVPLVQVILLIVSAILLYRNPPAAPAVPAGTRFERPRVTFLSRTLGVLLVLAGLTRLWLSLLIGPDFRTHPFGFVPCRALLCPSSFGAGLLRKHAHQLVTSRH